MDIAIEISTTIDGFCGAGTIGNGSVMGSIVPTTNNQAKDSKVDIDDNDGVTANPNK